MKKIIFFAIIFLVSAQIAYPDGTPGDFATRKASKIKVKDFDDYFDSASPSTVQSALEQIVASYPIVTPDLTIYGDLLPDRDNLRNIGSVDLTWKEIFGRTYQASDIIVTDTASAEIVDTQYIENSSDSDVKFRSDILLIDDARVTKYEWLSASGVSAPTAAAATLETNDNGFLIYTFPDGLERYVRYNLKVPDWLDLSAKSFLCVGWSSPAQNLNCDWEVTYLITALNESTDQAGTNDTDNYETSSAVADGLVNSEIITFPGGTFGSDDICVHVILMRDGNDDGDTLGDVAELHGVAFGGIRNKLGE